MQSDLQRIVDAIAAHVGRPALIEDRHQRVVAYSEHTGVIDEVRRTAILRRRTLPEVAARLRHLGIRDAREPVRIPACPELDLLPRVCVPIRHHDLLLGFVWFLDPDGTLPDSDLGVTGLLEELTLTLYRENLLGELAAQRETEATRILLADNAESRERAVRAILDGGMIAGDGPVTALVAYLVTPHGRHPDKLARIALEQALVATRRWLSTREALHMVRHDHGVLLLTGAPDSGHPSPEVVAKHLDDGLLQAIRRVDSVEQTIVGIGQTHPRLADAVRSYRQALQAARVGVQLPMFGRVIPWSGLGVYRVLSRLDARHLDLHGVHPGLERLIRDQTNLVLLETLERYLDLAGNAHATAKQLRLHRATLYYRLRRIEELAETDLKDGNERLCLHLTLKLARLTGHYRPEG